MFETRKYVIIPVSEIDSVDFSEVLETSAETCRCSVDGSLTFVKYIGEMPMSLYKVTDKQGPYSHAEIIEILNSEQWTSSEDEAV
jgi:hypothetical protein